MGRILTVALAAFLAGCTSTPAVYYQHEMKADINAQRYDDAVARIEANPYQSLRYSNTIAFFEQFEQSFRSVQDAASKSPGAMETAIGMLEKGPGQGRLRRDAREVAFKAQVWGYSGKKQQAAQAVLDYLNQGEPERTTGIWHCKVAPAVADTATHLGMNDYAVQAWRRSTYGWCGQYAQNYKRAISKLEELGAADVAEEARRRRAVSESVNRRFYAEVNRRCPGAVQGCNLDWTDFWKADQYQAAGLTDVAAYLRASGQRDVQNVREAETRRTEQASAAAQPAPESTAVGVLGALNEALQQAQPGIAAQQADMRARQQAQQQARANALVQQQLQATQQQNQLLAQQQSQAARQQTENERLRRDLAASQSQQTQLAAQQSAQAQAQADALRRQQAEQRAQDEARRRQQVAESNIPQVESFFRNNLYYLRNKGDRRVLCQVSAMMATAGIGAKPGLQPYQKAVVLFPKSEEAPFTGPVGNPRFFDCKVM
jgi:hypothetical protein